MTLATPLQACENALHVALDAVYKAEDAGDLATADANDLRALIRASLDHLGDVA